MPTLNLNLNKPINIEKDYSSLIKIIDDLIIQCTSHEPNFDIIHNNYFINNTESLIGQFNKYLFKLLNKPQNKNEFEDNQKIRSYYKKSFGKHLIVGSGNAGKSSIIVQFISNWDQDQLENIKPTFNK
jgi:hypothetical protein